MPGHDVPRRTKKSHGVWRVLVTWSKFKTLKFPLYMFLPAPCLATERRSEEWHILRQQLHAVPFLAERDVFRVDGSRSTLQAIDYPFYSLDSGVLTHRNLRAKECKRCLNPHSERSCPGYLQRALCFAAVLRGGYRGKLLLNTEASVYETPVRQTRAHRPNGLSPLRRGHADSRAGTPRTPPQYGAYA